jgi:hypothetical protein
LNATTPDRAEARTRWAVALCGTFFFLFSLIALSGPGRIDIVDGQTRYEVGRSLVDHGDVAIRLEDYWWGVFPGRNGRSFTTYRFPQSLLAVTAIRLADFTGPVSEGHRHFFFTLTSALAAALLGPAYAIWFRHCGLTRRRAILWAVLGVLTTPCWFYGTSTFDDILGACAIVWAITLARTTRNGCGLLGAGMSGLLLGWSFNCKPPLGVFVLPTLAGLVDPGIAMRRQIHRAALLLAGLALGLAVYLAYERYKFPPGTADAHADLLEIYAPVWFGNPFAALLSMVASPGAAFPLYCPPIVLCVAGFLAMRNGERLFTSSVLAATVVFLGFVSLLCGFKGDPAWGPRYATPIFALWWLFAPASLSRLSGRLVRLLLATGMVVQVLALSVDPHRLYVQYRLPSAYYCIDPWLYFNPDLSHLLNRPREVFEIVSWTDRADQFTPARAPTFAFPILDFLYREEKEPIRRFHILSSLRPWWMSMRYLPPEQRPVCLASAAWFFAVGMLAGGLLTWTAIRKVPCEPIERIGVCQN